MVSYESSVQALAEEVMQQLETKGYLVWSPEDSGGHNVAEDISEGVENAWAVISLLTPNYQSSDDCREQLRYAKKHKKPIIPIMVMSNWTPTSWLDFSITDVQRLKWESIQPEGVAQKMPELFLRLRTLFTGEKPNAREVRAVRRAAAGPERQMAALHISSSEPSSLSRSNQIRNRSHHRKS
jgi:hypothetical protein